MEETMSSAQLEAGKELVAYLKDKYEITNVKGHRDLTATSCPGTNFPFNAIAKATKNEGGLPMSQYEELKKLIMELKPTVFNSIDEIPTWGKPVKDGHLQGSNEGLNLSMDMLRVFVVLDRAGLFN